MVPEKIGEVKRSKNTIVIDTGRTQTERGQGKKRGQLCQEGDSSGPSAERRLAIPSAEDS